MTKVEQYALLKKFIDDKEEQAEYDTYISDLWPVLTKCREVALNNPQLIKGWLAIAVELYKVPEDITELYKVVVGFVEWYYDEIVNVAPTSEELQNNHE